MTLPAEILPVAVTLLLAAFGALYAVLDRRLNSVEKDLDSAAAEGDVEEVRGMVEDNRRLAETAYTTVHGDAERPEDEGLVVEHDARIEALEERTDQIEAQLNRVERDHESEMNRIWRALEALAEEAGANILTRGGGDAGD